MYTFIIQLDRKNGMPIEDFAFTMIQAIDYHKWYYGKNATYDYITVYAHNDCECVVHNGIPVGSIEFTEKIMKKYYNVDLLPINIPKLLLTKEFTKRDVWFDTTTTDTFNADKDPVFVKSTSKIKGFTSVVCPNSGYPAGEYMFSTVIDILSEWRIFVDCNSIVGCQNYSGDFFCLPSETTIRKMMNAYINSPRSYALDVAVTSNFDTVIIECHDIFSCGLYGFADFNLLPRMYRSWFLDTIKQKG